MSEDIGGPTVSNCPRCGAHPICERTEGKGIRYRCPNCPGIYNYNRTLVGAVLEWEARRAKE